MPTSPHPRSSACRTLVLLAGCLIASFSHAQPSPKALPDEHQSWDYPPFGASDTALFQAFQNSCSKLLNRQGNGPMLASRPEFGTIAQWQQLCRNGLTKKPAQLKQFFEENLVPVQLAPRTGANRKQANGTPYAVKFTGYYKPVLEGSRRRYGPYQTPILAKPDDLVVCNGKSGQKLPNGSCRNPYPTRAQINANISRYRVLAWVKDPVAAYFMQIQGSGTIELDTGPRSKPDLLHIGFAAKNGHPYVAIGTVMLQQKLIAPPLNAQKISKWLAANPSQAQAILNHNPSYIFFAETPTESPGALGVPLTGGRSLAVDRDYIPLGLPVVVDTTNTHDNLPWRRIMFAQDVGSAIQGPVRGDIYFGHGPLAGERAGSQNAGGTLAVLVPKENLGFQAAELKKPQPLPTLADAALVSTANIMPAAGPATVATNVSSTLPADNLTASLWLPLPVTSQPVATTADAAPPAIEWFTPTTIAPAGSAPTAASVLDESSLNANNAL